MDSKAIWKSKTFWVNFSALPLLPFLQLVGLDAELSAKITLGVNMAANMVLRLFFVPDEPVAKLSIK
jgi:hypothetical protein